MALKQARPPPKKKSKRKSKAAITEPSDVDKSQIGDVSLENDGSESQEDSVEKAQHASYWKTRSHSGDLVSGLPAKTPTKKRQNENSPPSSGDSVMSALPPMICVPGHKRRKGKLADQLPLQLRSLLKTGADSG